MENFLIMMVINSVALIVVAALFKGIVIKNWFSLILSALFMGIVNAFIKPFILILTLPVNILTLGLLTLFINGLLLYFVSKIVKGFDIKSYWDAFFGALIFSIVSIILNWMII